MLATLVLRCFALCSLCLAMSGCQTPPSADSEAESLPAATAVAAAAEGVLLDALPAGSHWALASSTATGLDRSEATAIRLSIESDRLSGDSSCNRFSAGYQLLDKRLSVGPPVATKRGCQSPAAEIEQALFVLLPTLVSASMDGSDLILHGAGEVRLRFTPALAPEH